MTIAKIHKMYVTLNSNLLYVIIIILLPVKFECCGVNNSTDYVNTTFPISCCALQTDTRGKTAKDLWNTNDGSTYTFTINDVNCAGSYAAIVTKQVIMLAR